MMNIVNNIIFILGLVIALNSYKKIEVKKNIVLYVLLSIISIVIDLVLINDKVWNDIFRIICYYISIKLIIKEKANVIDIFFIQLELFSYYILKKTINSNIYPEVLIFIISMLFLLNKNRLININHNLIHIWNTPEKGLTMRCILVILLNLSVYVIYRFR